MVAAVKIAPDKLTGTERAVLAGLAEATPKGQRKSMATQDELMSIAGLKSRNGIDKVLRGLAERGFIRHERARLGHPAVYHLLFDAWVYDEAAREMRPPQVTQPASSNHEDGSPTGDATRRLRHPREEIGSPGGDVSPSTPKRPSLPSVDLGARLRRAGITDDTEQREITEWIKVKNKVRGTVEVYLAPFTDEQLADTVKAWRADRAAKPAKSRHGPWCGTCNKETRQIEDPVTRDPIRCTCHADYGKQRKNWIIRGKDPAGTPVS